MVSFFPNFVATEASESNRIVFLIDLSRSMIGQPLEDSKRHVIKAIRFATKKKKVVAKVFFFFSDLCSIFDLCSLIESKTAFEIWTFSTFLQQIVDISTSRNDAIQAVSELTKCEGGSNISLALRSIFLLGENQFMNVILFSGWESFKAEIFIS